MTHTYNLGFDVLVITGNFSQASSPIGYMVDSEEVNTPFQVADARHDPKEALRLVVEWLGTDYYGEDGDVDSIVAEAEENEEDEEDEEEKNEEVA